MLKKNPFVLTWLKLHTFSTSRSHCKRSTYSPTRAIFVWPWNENARTKQKQQTNGNRAIWLVYGTDTNERGFRLVKRTLGWKKFMPENFLEINRYFALTSHCNKIENNKSSCFDLFILWLIRQITNIFFFFSRSYENRSICHLFSLQNPLQ